ncbi:MAG: cellulase family glycosylhydrolase, partial [Bacteroidota bacterium]|nr:cellulase family glycosylhydrolase [Bacteroidota bacterium]
MKKLLLILQFAVIASLAIGQAPITGYYYATDTVVSTYPDHKKGHLYHNGEIINIRGINWFGIGINFCDADGLYMLDWNELLQMVEDLGFNAIRLVVSGEVFYNHINGTDGLANCIQFANGMNSELVGLTDYELVHALIGKCEEIGLYVLIDHHDMGPGSGLWYDANDVVNTTNDYLESLISVADSFAQYDNIIGIDLINEPYGAVWNNSNAINNWRNFSNQAGDSILAHNPNWLVTIEGVQYTGDILVEPVNQTYLGGYNQYNWGENLSSVRNWPSSLPDYKIIYSPHTYQFEHSFINESNADTLDNFLPEINDWKWGYLADDYAVMPGEFGVSYNNCPYGEKWLEHIIKYIAEKKLPGSFYWALNGNDEILSILETDWQTVRQDKLDDILVLFGTVKDTFSTDGGTMYSPRDGTTYTFGQGDLAWNTIIYHNSWWSGQANIPDLGSLGSILHEFEITSTQAAMDEFKISINYTDNELGTVDETKLSFYYYNGSNWVLLQSSLDTSLNKIETLTSQFGYYAVLEGNNATSIFVDDANEAVAGYYYASDVIVGLYPNHKKGHLYHHGELINLRGINWYDIGVQNCDAHGLNDVEYTELLQNIVEMGFNAVRLVYSGNVIRNHISGNDEPVSCIATTLGDNSIFDGMNEYELLETIVAKCEEMGLYVLLAHQDSIYNGNLWYDTSDIVNTTNEYISNLTMLADSFAQYENVIGIDIVYQPYAAVWNGSGNDNDFRSFINIAGSSILQHNSNWLIFAEGVQYTADASLSAIEQSELGGNNQFGMGENLAGIKNWPVDLPTYKIVFSPHSFNYNFSFVNQNTIDSIDSYLPAINDWRWGYLAEDYALVPGAFGIGYQEYSYSEKWMEHFVKYLAEKKIPGSFYWSLNGNDPAMGILESDFQTVKQNKLSDLQVLFGTVSDTISASGGTIYSPRDASTYTFGTGNLPDSTIVIHNSSWSGQAAIPGLDNMRSILHEFEVISTNPANSEFTISVIYSNNELGAVDETRLSFYYYSGSEWEIVESTLDTSNNQIETSTDQFGFYAILETKLSTLAANACGHAAGYYFATDSILDLYPDHKKGNFYHDGELLNIRGINWYDIGIHECDLAGLWAVDYVEVLQGIKDLGFNTIRLIYGGDVIRNFINGTNQPSTCIAYWIGQNNFLYGQSEYALLNHIIGRCEEMEIHVLLGHQDEIYSNNLWFDATDIENTRNEYINNLVFVAEHFGHYSNIIGIDLVSEPYGATWNGSGAANDYRDFINMAGDSVLSHCQDWMIFAQGLQYTSDSELTVIEQSGQGGNNQIGFGENLAGVSKWPLSIPNHKIVFTPQTNTYKHTFVNESTIDTIDNYLSEINDWRWGYLAEEHAVMPGGFGISYPDYSYGEEWLEGFVKYMAEKKLPGSFYWAINGDSYEGLYESDMSTLKEDKYRDLIVLYGLVDDTISSSGDTIYSPRDGTSYYFDAGDLPNNTYVKHVSMWSGKANIPELGKLKTILHEFEVISTDTANSEFTISVEYTNNELGSVDESSLSFYRHNGTYWELQTSILDTTNNIIEINTDLFGVYAVVEIDTTVGNGADTLEIVEPFAISGYYFANDSIVDLYPIHKKGNIYHAGELINLRGATWTGLGVDNCDFEGLYAVDYTIFLQNLKDKGFNALRLVYSGDVVRDRINGTEVLGECVATWAGDNSDFIDKNEYEFLQLVIEKCEELEIYVLLAHHDKIYSGNLWYDTTDVQNTKNEYISNLIFLANDLAQHENIIGIDLIADPYGSVWNGSGSDNDYRDFLNMAGDSILFHNPDWLIFAEGIQYTSDTELSAIEQSDLGGNNQYGYAENLAGVRKWPLNIPGHKIIFAPQTFQNEHSYVNEFTCDTLDNFLPAINDWRWGYLADDYAVVPGAFGVNYQQYSYNEKWMEHFVKYMAEKKLPGSFYYKLNANDGRG